MSSSSLPNLPEPLLSLIQSSFSSSQLQDQPSYTLPPSWMERKRRSSSSSTKYPPYKRIKKNIYTIPVKQGWVDLEPCSCNSKKSLQCNSECENALLNVECIGKNGSKSNCSLGPDCGNRRLQKNISPSLKLVPTPGKGWGIFAGEDIQAGTFIIEYIGEIIDRETQNKRLLEAKERGEHHAYMMEINSNEIIDARFASNLARFVNHCCDPNAQLQRWSINGFTRIGIFAIKDIKEGTEVSYDYDFDTVESNKCYCGAENCRQIFAGKKSIEKMQQLQLKGKRR
jgi:[histone H3]-lysine36 N-dimethyltransferase NSD2